MLTVCIRLNCIISYGDVFYASYGEIFRLIGEENLAFYISSLLFNVICIVSSFILSLYTPLKLYGLNIGVMIGSYVVVFVCYKVYLDKIDKFFDKNKKENFNEMKIIKK